MKKSSIFSVLLVALLSTFVAKGAFTNFVGFGSVSNAINLYAVPNSKGMSMDVYQDSTQGTVYARPTFNANINFTNKEALDAFFQQQVDYLAQGALTNSLINKDQPLKIFAITSRNNFNLGILRYLYFFGEFSLIRSTNGSYSLPSFSNLNMRLVGTMIWEVSSLEWARIEGYYNPSTPSPTNPFPIEDSRYDPPDKISVSENYIEIPTDFATSGSNGPVHLKISLVTKSGTNYNFRVFGPEGTQVPETPFYSKNFRMSGGQASLDIVGGDPGRVIKMQKASNLSGPWIDVGVNMVVPPYQLNLHFEDISAGSMQFYRIRTCNAIPF